jgi:hypothetical protein
MKFVPKFKLGILLYGEHLVPHVHDIVLGLMASFLRIKLRV